MSSPFERLTGSTPKALEEIASGRWPAEARSAAQLVEYLADPHRYVLACQQLIGVGVAAGAAARTGLTTSMEHRSC